MQFSKTANFQLSKKRSKLKEYSAFINARNLLDGGIKCDYYF
jgi:IS5 family transposase